MIRGPQVIIFMGVAGSGKSTIGSRLAQAIGAVFYEGDQYHSPASVEKMRRGEPLTDEDRAQWLATLRDIIVRALAAGELAVMTCSALKEKYRVQLQAGDGRVNFVHLKAPRGVLERRLKTRPGHFLAPSLLSNQLEVFEQPTDAIVIDGEKSPEEIVRVVIGQLKKML